MDPEYSRHFRSNYFFNILDGGFFGFAIGFASFTTIIPLFISSLTDSAILIGMIPAIHSMGWQLPQIFTARTVSRQKRFLPMTLVMTVHERIPFLGLAIIAWFLPVIGKQTALILAFLMLIWQGLGGGFTANPWQMLITRVIPMEYRATFYGMQSAASSLLASGGAIAAGYILERYRPPFNYALCFLIAAFWMIFSWFFISRTHETSKTDAQLSINLLPMWQTIQAILKRDKPFLWFVISKIISQFGVMGFAFYTIYAVRNKGISAEAAGIMTSVLFITQVVANPLLGWVADRWKRKYVLELGAVAICLSTLMAYFAINLSWFFGIMVLTGIANTAFWTIGLALTSEFGTEAEKPTYIGLANTLTAPATILAPIFGGWLADISGYRSTFLAAAIAGGITFLVLTFFVSDPKKEG